MPKQDTRGWAMAWVLMISMALSVSMAGILHTGHSIYAEGRKEADRVQARMTAAGLAEAMAGSLEREDDGLGRILGEKAGHAMEMGREEKSGEELDGTFSCGILLTDGWPRKLGDVDIRAFFQPGTGELLIEIRVEKGGQQAETAFKAAWEEDGWRVLGYAPVESCGTQEGGEPNEETIP